MPRAYTRRIKYSDSESEQTHDDRDSLNEEDGKEQVFGDVRAA
jgi:hypothetical protein